MHCLLFTIINVHQRLPRQSDAESPRRGDSQSSRSSISPPSFARLTAFAPLRRTEPTADRSHPTQCPKIVLEFRLICVLMVTWPNRHLFFLNSVKCLSVWCSAASGRGFAAARLIAARLREAMGKERSYLNPQREPVKIDSHLWESILGITLGSLRANVLQHNDLRRRMPGEIVSQWDRIFRMGNNRSA